MKYIHLSLLVLLWSLQSCVDDAIDNPAVQNSREYFPLIIGKFVEYQVDSIVFDDAPGGNKKDTISFQLREEIGEYHLTASGDTTYYINRFRRNSPELNWILKDVWKAYVEENNALRTEENLTFRKMTLPLYKGLEWIGTSYINPQTSIQVGTENLEAYQYWEARVLGIDEAGQVGSFTFPVGQVMHVRQTDTDDELMIRSVYETYVRNIGLVARIDTILDSRCIALGDFGPCIGQPWTNHASKGYILSQIMLDHN